MNNADQVTGNYATDENAGQQEPYFSHQETQENSPGGDNGDEEEDDELIPIPDDEEDDNSEEDAPELSGRPTTSSADAGFTSRSHGRTTGTLTDHEPGINGPVGGRQ